MRDELPSLARAILDTLLDRFEQPRRQRAVRVHLDERRHHGYFHAPDVAVRRAINETLQRLASDGCLRLYWRPWEEGNWLAKVELVAERAETIYARLGRVPLPQQEQRLRELLAAQKPHAPWHAAWLDWVKAQLDARAAVAPLKLSTAPVDDQWNCDLLAALAAIAQLRAPLLERKLSVQLFGDSKRFEALRGAVLSVLRRHAAESAAFGDDDQALLRAFQLARAPEFVPLAGPLVLRLADSVLNLTPFTPSVALPSATVREASITACAARAVVTIENLTSFGEFAAARPADVLAVYLGGFASPAVITLLSNLRATCPQLPFFHWGDLDAGGLRILAHLRKQVGVINPLAMGAELLNDYQQQAQPLTARERDNLRSLLEQPVLADCAPLIERLLATNRKLEQEAIELEVCLRLLAQIL
jgi:hypothetical protein